MVANGQITRDEHLFYHLADVQPKKPLKYEKKKAEPTEQ
jgi:hypothetical protein